MIDPPFGSAKATADNIKLTIDKLAHQIGEEVFCKLDPAYRTVVRMVVEQQVKLVLLAWFLGAKLPQSDTDSEITGEPDASQHNPTADR